MKRSRESPDEILNKIFKNLQKKETEKWVFLNACREGDLDFVKRCLNLGTVNVEAKDDRHGRSGIHNAAYYGHVEIVKVLIQSSAM